MKVILLDITKDPDRLMYAAARTCYSAETPDYIFKNSNPYPVNHNLTVCRNKEKENEINRLLKHLIKSGHHSVFEHAKATFGIEGISRACSHQLVRHRIASFSQQSQRYVSYEDIEFIIPPSIKGTDLEFPFERNCRTGLYNYKTMISEGVKEEDARYLLPNATATNIVVTMNFRELLHFFNVRCCNRAQWEIRDLAWEMYKQVKDKSIIFNQAGPNCLVDKCKESKPCGNPYKKEME